MAHEFLGVKEYVNIDNSTLRDEDEKRAAEMIAFDHAREYIRNKEFRGFKTETTVNGPSHRRQARCNLTFYQAL